MSANVIIIGAGVGGLSAGCYAQMNGLSAHIFEMHASPGGVCTSWVRKGYTFDGCIHNLAGTTPSSPFHRIWRELGVRQPMHAYSELISIENPNGGQPLLISARLSDLQSRLKAQFPEDAAEIDRLITAARLMQETDLLGLAVAPAAERLKAAFVLARLGGVAGLTLEAYAQRFRNPFLRQAFPRIVYDWPGQSILMALYFLAGLDKGDLGWPVGGSGAFAHAIERRFRELGGRIDYQKRVASIIVENDRAVGVRFEDGSEARADYVISNAYGPATIFAMLGGRYADARIRKHYAQPDDKIDMGIHISIGVARDLRAEPHAVVWPLPKPAVLDGESHDRLFIQIFGFDPTLAPTGKGVIKVLLPTKWERWRRLASDPQRYKREQEILAEAVLAQLEARFPGIGGQVETVDVATPISTERFTGNGPGYAFSTATFAAALLFGWKFTQRLPRLRNFYMVGQWAGLPGVPMVAAMGRDVIRDICRRQGRRFASSASKPGAQAEAAAA